MTGLTQINGAPGAVTGKKFKLPGVKNTSGETKRGIIWVIEDAYEKGVIDKKHARLIIGENIDIQNNKSTKPIYFNFVSTIHKPNNMASPA